MSLHLRFCRGLTDSRKLKRAAIEFVRVLPEIIEVKGRVCIEFLPVPEILYEATEDSATVLNDSVVLNSACGLFLPYTKYRPPQFFILICGVRNQRTIPEKKWIRHVLTTMAHELVHHEQIMADRELVERGVDRRAEWIVREACAISPLLNKLLADAN